MPMGLEADALRLRTALRDLVALSAVPAAWIGREPPAIAAGLADVLVNSLRLDFAFVRLRDPNGGATVEIARGSAWPAFPQWLHHHLAAGGHLSRREIVRDGTRGDRGIVIPVGGEAEGGGGCGGVQSRRLSQRNRPAAALCRGKSCGNRISDGTSHRRSP